MHLTELLDYLRGLGLVLWAEGDALRYRAPKGVLTPVLMQQLREHKVELLQLLHATQQGDDAHLAPLATTSVAVPPTAPASQADSAQPRTPSASQITAMIKAKLADVLFLEVKEIDEARPLSEFGLDSVLGIELIKSINDQYGLSVRATELYEHPTVAELSTYLASLIDSGRTGGNGMEQLYDAALGGVAGASAGPSTAAVHEARAPVPPSPAASVPGSMPTQSGGPSQATRLQRAGETAEPAPQAPRIVLKKLSRAPAAAMPAANVPAPVQPSAPLLAAAPATVGGDGVVGYRIDGMTDIDALACVAWSLPPPQDCEIQVDVMSAALNFGDLLCLNGLYPSMPAYPFVAGFEVAGVVRSVGRGVVGFEVGDEVLAVTGANLGGHASRVNVHERLAVRKPANLAFAEAASLPVVFITAYHSLCEVARVRAGETVLIQTAAGGVGSIAVQIAKHRGAVVIGTTGSPEKARFLHELGVDHVLDYRDPQFAASVKQITGGRGVDVVLNTLAEMIQTGLDVLAPGGRYVELAVAALKASRSLNLARLCDNQSFHSVDLRRYFIGLAAGQHRDLGYGDYLGILAKMAGAGEIRAVISHQFGFEELPQALGVLRSRTNVGKVVVNRRVPARPVVGDVEEPRTEAAGAEPVAIIGMSGRFPGADNLDAFWHNLRHGVDAVQEVPAERWDADAYAPHASRGANTTHCRWGGFVNDAGRFDAAFFNISPLEAQSMDPQQRLLLEECWKAIEQAGYDPESLPTRRVGVFIGASQSEYSHRFVDTERGLDGYVLMGGSSAILSARISYFLNLQGPNLCVDTSCSSSLVALELACRSLVTGQCDMALAGGVSVLAGPGLHIMAGRAGMLSTTGRCRTFGQDADGFVPAEAAGVVVLKRLSQARADGDIVHAVIRGIEVNQDGRSIGITAPNGRAQEELIVQVQRAAGIDPRTIGYVETHGTGTKLGDPIEFDALTRAFRRGTSDRGFCAIGSVKSNIGHALAAAGVSGLMKVVLSLKNRELVPTLHCSTVNDHLDVESSPFHLNRDLRPWPAPAGELRRAALSSFGFSGTNCHAIIEEAGEVPVMQSRSAPRAYPILLSAKTAAALLRKAEGLHAWLLAAPDRGTEELADLAANLCDRRGHYRHRLAIVAGDMPELVQRLEAFLRHRDADGVMTGEVGVGDEPDDLARRGESAVREAAGHLAAADGVSEAARALLTGVANLYVQGFNMSWAALFPLHAYRRLVLPAYPLAGEVHWPPQAAAKPHVAVPATPVDAPSTGSGDWTFVPGWAPVRDAQANDAPNDAARNVLLVFVPAAAQTARALRHAHAGAAVREIQLADASRRRDDGCWDVDADDAAGWRDALHDLGVASGWRVYFLAGPSTASVEAVPAKQLFRLSKGLLALGLDRGALDLVAVTGGACNVDDDELPDAASAAALGFALSIAKELRNWRIRAVDTPEPQTPAQAEAFARDLCCRVMTLNERSVALWRGNRLYEQKLRRVELPVPATSRLRRGGVYLIVGGMGGIGFALASHLAQQHGARLLLAGRSPQDADKASRLEQLRRLGGSAIYVQADLGDEASLRRAVDRAIQDHGALHGVFHSAFELRDASFARMTELDFDGALAAKTRGCINLAEALRGVDTDFLVFFSSVQSFVANPGQSNYAAASRYQDACALALRRTHGLRACVVNWGYWGSVGAVADEAHRARNAGQGALSIEPAEAFDLLERSLAAAHTLPQVVAVKLRPELVASIPEIEHDFRLRLLDQDDAVTASGVDENPVAFDAAELDPDLAAGYRRMENWGLRSAALALRAECGVLASAMPADAKAIAEAVHVVPAQERLLHAVLDKLVQRQLLSRDLEGRYAATAALRADTVQGLAAEREAVVQAHPSVTPFLDLLAVCTPAFPGILSGRVASTSILFAEGSTRLVEAAYRGNAMADHVNARVVDVLRSVCDHWPRSRPLRILEIGAGTGGTTRPVLDELRRQGIECRYDFTDISESFLGWARSELAADFPGLAARRFDVDRCPVAQGFEPGAYDLVLAANVLHATRDIRRSVRHAKALLGHGGRLVLNESVVDTVFATLTFGTLEGWWKFEDARERLAGSPLLSRDMWCELLRTEGMRQPRWIESERESGFMPMAVLVAFSDGCAAQDLQPPAASPLPSAHPTGSAPASPVDAAVRQDICERLVLSVGRILQCDPAGIDTRLPYSEYGVDSINGLQIIEAVNADLGVDVKPTDLFTHSSIDKLANHLAAQGLRPQAAAPHRPVSAVPALAGAQVPPVKAGPRERVMDDAIAVIGMSGRFPSAPDLDAFWRNLAEGRDCIREVPPDRWDAERFFDADPRAPRRTYSKWGGYLDGIDLFDPSFFNIAPREAEHMDPQQRLFLQEAWHAFEDAGYAPSMLDGKRCGVFVGCGQGDYQLRFRNATDMLESHAFLGNSNAILAARISYFLNLTGPSLTVDTACSSSLVAAHLACESLRRGECELALAGGVRVLAGPQFHVLGSKSGMLSPTGRCRAFDDDADGFVPGECTSVLVLKRLEQAVADGDEIYAVIRGSRTNQDGRTNGITAPSVLSQADLIGEVHELCKVTADSIGQVETHGTGTRLGDPIEVEALTQAFRRHTNRRGFCALGSVKTNIGHSLEAAGVAGLTKMVLSLHRKKLAPSLHFRRPNRHIAFNDSPFFVNTQLADWRRHGDAAPLRGAVSSFGFSGTNCHMVLDEWRP